MQIFDRHRQRSGHFEEFGQRLIWTAEFEFAFGASIHLLDAKHFRAQFREWGWKFSIIDSTAFLEELKGSSQFCDQIKDYYNLWKTLLLYWKQKNHSVIVLMLFSGVTPLATLSHHSTCLPFHRHLISLCSLALCVTKSRMLFRCTLYLSKFLTKSKKQAFDSFINLRTNIP